MCVLFCFVPSFLLCKWVYLIIFYIEDYESLVFIPFFQKSCWIVVAATEGNNNGEQQLQMVQVIYPFYENMQQN